MVYSDIVIMMTGPTKRQDKGSSVFSKKEVERTSAIARTSTPINEELTNLFAKVEGLRGGVDTLEKNISAYSSVAGPPTEVMTKALENKRAELTAAVAELDMMNGVLEELHAFRASRKLSTPVEPTIETSSSIPPTADAPPISPALATHVLSTPAKPAVKNPDAMEIVRVGTDSSADPAKDSSTVLAKWREKLLRLYPEDVRADLSAIIDGLATTFGMRKGRISTMLNNYGLEQIKEIMAVAIREEVSVTALARFENLIANGDYEVDDCGKREIRYRSHGDPKGVKSRVIQLASTSREMCAIQRVQGARGSAIEIQTFEGRLKLAAALAQVQTALCAAIDTEYGVAAGYGSRKFMQAARPQIDMAALLESCIKECNGDAEKGQKLFATKLIESAVKDATASQDAKSTGSSHLGIISMSMVYGLYELLNQDLRAVEDLVLYVEEHFTLDSEDIDSERSGRKRLRDDPRLRGPDTTTPLPSELLIGPIGACTAFFRTVRDFVYSVDGSNIALNERGSLYRYLAEGLTSSAGGDLPRVEVDDLATESGARFVRRALS